jgi:hypothetical protein
MGEKSEVFYDAEVGDSQVLAPPVETNYRRDLLEITVVFGCILVAVWTPPGSVNAFFSIVAAACVVAFAVAGRWRALELGLKRPLAGAGYILLAGAILCGVIALIGIPMRSAGAAYTVPLSRSWQYAVWALQQEFILQSIFFLRLEAMLGSRRAVIAAAALFSLVHIPNPILTVFSLCGGILFCELFRRWRNLYPLGIIHGALGLTIAASLPDKWLHHMRVGIGYLMLHV